jgi:alanine racemase
VQKPNKTITLRPRLSLAEEALRPTRAEISLSAIAQNLAVVRRATRARVLAVVKADGYGHGVVPVAARLDREGVDGFGVALAEEGIELRDAGVESRILVLNGVYGDAHAEVLATGLTPVIYDLDEAARFEASSGGEPFEVHLKVDTGMGRLGVPLSRLEAFLTGLSRFQHLRIEGLMTHFASADGDRETTREQLERFDGARKLVARFGHRPSIVHAANSAALFRHPESHFDMVRVGVALYGAPPCEGIEDVGLAPVMRLRTQIIAIREIEAGEGVGYSQTFRAARRTRVATVPMGYGDGLMRSLSNRGAMLVRGERCPIVGNVSMDLTCLDVTDLAEARVGDEVVVLGEQQGARITADEMAAAAGTIGYEILTNVSRRVPRVY